MFVVFVVFKCGHLEPQLRQKCLGEDDVKPLLNMQVPGEFQKKKRNPSKPTNVKSILENDARFDEVQKWLLHTKSARYAPPDYAESALKLETIVFPSKGH